MMKIEADEKRLRQAVERGEWKSAGVARRERTRFARVAKATFRKDQRLNIRLSSKDLEAIQKRALVEGVVVSSTDLEPAAQVRVRTPQRGRVSVSIHRWCFASSLAQAPQRTTGTMTRSHVSCPVQ
jgi:predicted DNA binding CopG/RHH family protein